MFLYFLFSCIDFFVDTKVYKNILFYKLETLLGTSNDSFLAPEKLADGKTI